MTYINFPWAALVALIVAIVGWFSGLILIAFKLGRMHQTSRSNHAFIRKMKNNHLPHIYRALQKICDELNIKLEE